MIVAVIVERLEDRGITLPPVFPPAGNEVLVAVLAGAALAAVLSAIN